METGSIEYYQQYKLCIYCGRPANVTGVCTLCNFNEGNGYPYYQKKDDFIFKRSICAKGNLYCKNCGYIFCEKK